MERDALQPNQATPSAGTQAACGVAPSAPTPGSLAAELRELRARLRHAHKHAAAALDGPLAASTRIFTVVAGPECLTCHVPC